MKNQFQGKGVGRRIVGVINLPLHGSEAQESARREYAKASIRKPRRS